MDPLFSSGEALRAESLAEIDVYLLSEGYSQGQEGVDELLFGDEGSASELLKEFELIQVIEERHIDVDRRHARDCCGYA
jgi:hypothetical protein